MNIEKFRQTMIAKYGSEQAWIEARKKNSSKGGKNTDPSKRTFSVLKRTNPELLREITSRGGKSGKSKLAR
jgi:hypothetical protein